MGYTAVLFGLSAFLFCIQGSYGKDVVLDSYTITAPADPLYIGYNRVTDTTITFTATVSSPRTGGNIEGIDVYFADTNDTEITGTKVAAGGTAPTGAAPEAIGGGGVTSQDLAGNTATLKFATEADCTAATQLCVQIKGLGVAAVTDVQCLDIGATTGQAGTKDCTVDPTTVAPTASTIAATEPGCGAAGISNGIYCVLISLCIYTAMITQ